MATKMMPPEKECEICGRIFTVTNLKQKYCHGGWQGEKYVSLRETGVL